LAKIFKQKINKMKKQLFTLALSALSLGAFCQSTIWQPYNSNLDTSASVRYISVVDTNTVWGVGFLSGHTNTNWFTRTIDGQNFHSGKIFPDTSKFNISNISAVDANTAYVAAYFIAATGTSGRIMKTTNGGATWSVASDTTTMFAGASNFPDWVYFWNANNGIALGDPNGSTAGSGVNMFEIWRTNNGGTSWTRVADANVPVPVSGEFGLTNSYTTYGKWIWSGTSDGNRVYASADSGKTWTVNPTNLGLAGGISNLAFRDSLHGFLLAGTISGVASPVLYKTADGGQTWTPSNLGVNVGTNYISSIPKTKGFMSVGFDSATAVSTAGVVANGILTSVTYDDGATWTLLEAIPGGANASASWMQSVQMLDSLNGWAGNFSSDSPLPYGTNGMNRFGLGHKAGCPIALTYSSTSTPFNVCHGGSANITASGLNTYTWSTSATTASITVTPSVTTSYSVAGTTTTGCSNYETFNVTVVNPVVTVASHTLCLGHNLSLNAAGATTYSWSPGTYLSADTGSSVVCIPTGTTAIVYTVTGTEDLCSAQTTFTITVAGCAGIEQYSNNYNMSIYPNPSNGVITVSIASVDAGTVLYVTDVIGQEVMKTSIKDVNTNLDLSALQKGIYMLTITNGQYKHIEKIIIQ
jgi:photosystem II stability/assembly factor-like uncharacterized protein